MTVRVEVEDDPRSGRVVLVLQGVPVVLSVGEAVMLAGLCSHPRPSRAPRPREGQAVTSWGGR